MSPKKRTAATSGSSNFFSGHGGSSRVSAKRTAKPRSESAVAVFAAPESRSTTWVVGATWTTATSIESGGGPAAVSVQTRLAAS